MGGFGARRWSLLFVLALSQSSAAWARTLRFSSAARLRVISSSCRSLAGSVGANCCALGCLAGSGSPRHAEQSPAQARRAGELHALLVALAAGCDDGGAEGADRERHPRREELQGVSRADPRRGRDAELRDRRRVVARGPRCPRAPQLAERRKARRHARRPHHCVPRSRNYARTVTTWCLPDGVGAKLDISAAVALTLVDTTDPKTGSVVLTDARAPPMDGGTPSAPTAESPPQAPPAMPATTDPRRGGDPAPLVRRGVKPARGPAEPPAAALPPVGPWLRCPPRSLLGYTVLLSNMRAASVSAVLWEHILAIVESETGFLFARSAARVIARLPTSG